METIKGADMSSTPVLSPRQMRRMENLPEDYKVVKTRDGVVILRRADGQLLRMQPDGRLVANLTVERVQDYLHVCGG
jgi:hypothetical protein